MKSLKSMICKLQNMRDVIRRKLAILIFDRKGNVALDTVVVKEKIRVLVYRLDAKWGDSIISSFFYREIKKKGNVEVIVVSTQELYSLYKKSYNVDTVYSLKKRPSYRELWDVAKDIGKVDVVVHLTETIKMKELFFISKISPEIVFSLDDGLSIVSHKMGEQSKNISFRDKYCAVLSMLNVYDIKKEYIIPAHNEEVGNIDGYDILVNPFGSTIKKSLSVENGHILLKKLSDTFPDKRIGLINSPNTYEKALKMLGNRDIQAEVVSGISSFYDVVEIIRNSELLVSVDTALVHVADGLGKKLVAIFPKNNDEFNPWLPSVKPENKVVFSYADGVDVNLNNYDVVDVVDAIRSIYHH